MTVARDGHKCRANCGHCDPDIVINARLELWNVAYETLTSRSWPDDNKPNALDVLALADFLDGDG